MKSVPNGHCEVGVASWYGPGFNGKKTANGEVYDMYDFTAAHSVLPIHTVVKVINLANRREVVVRVNDRGPFVADRVIDLSLSAARMLGMVKDGTAPVQVRVIGSAKSSMAAALTSPAQRSPQRRLSRPFAAKENKPVLALR